MGFGVSITIGTRDMANAMVMLDKKAPGAGRKALAAAMKIAQRSAVLLAPVDTRLLKRSIKSRAYVRRDKSAIIGELLVRHNKTMVVRRGSKKPSVADPYYYTHLVELGTKAHALGKGSQRFSKRPTKSIPLGLPGKQHGNMHPGTRPRPFLRPALEQNEAVMVAAIDNVMSTELERMWNNA